MSDRVIDSAIEAQATQHRFIRLRETDTAVVSEWQYELISEYLSRAEMLGLRLWTDAAGTRLLQAGNRVGTIRFSSSPDQWLIVEVDPKLDSADVFRMLDQSNQRLPLLDSEASVISHADVPMSVIFLRYLATHIRRFLEDNHYKSYRFADSFRSSTIRGRPLIREYGLNCMPRGQLHIMPSRHIEYSRDVFDNRVLAYSVEIAQRLVTTLGLNSQQDIVRDLRMCRQLLAGVSAQRVTTRTLNLHRYTRSNTHFRAIHELCGTLLNNQSIALDPGQHITFAAFSLYMPSLFQKYVAAVMKAILGGRFVAQSSELEFPTGFGKKTIQLDGLILSGRERVVVEAKYRALDATDDTLALGGVPEDHIYQTVAYSTHAQVKADQALIVYPAWGDSKASVNISEAVDDFGWSSHGDHRIEIRLLGIDLAAPFQEVTDRAAKLLLPLLSGT